MSESHILDQVGYKKFMRALDKNIYHLKEINSGLKFPQLNLGLKNKQCVDLHQSMFWSMKCQHDLVC